jgi:phosphoribosylaminoimidazolecarboxamide formyltransferase/IMP cyclohydrolase
MTESDLRPLRRALVSVSDKTGLAELARALVGHGVEIVSTGGTARALAEAGAPAVEVAQLTGFPEVMGGRVKTLHPRIHGGILARRDHAGDVAQMSEHGMPPIDLVVVNLYPFEATVLAGHGRDACIEEIDIGGPALIRAAAKNHAFVAVVTDPADYGELVGELDRHNGTTLAFRRRLAASAFARTAAYDAAIAAWAAAEEGAAAEGGTPFPDRLALALRLKQELRYGENPHQRAALYLGGVACPGAATAEQAQGKDLSYNNIADTDAAFELAAEFERPAVVIVKHANPCGVAVADEPVLAWERALGCDPVSAYGGIVAVNRAIDERLAKAMAEIFLEVVIAPGADEGARAILSRKKNLRLLLTGALPDPAASGMMLRSVAGGYLLQSRDATRIAPTDLKVVTRRQPTAAELADLVFAFTVAKHVRSNAIVYAKGEVTVGIGAGQMSRVDSSRIAAFKALESARAAGEAGSRAEGAVVASDAFFPFADGLLAAAEAGVTAVIQPGGSLRDEEVIAAADARDLAMVFTGVRHFRH